MRRELTFPEPDTYHRSYTAPHLSSPRKPRHFSAVPTSYPSPYARCRSPTQPQIGQALRFAVSSQETLPVTDQAGERSQVTKHCKSKWNVGQRVHMVTRE